MEEERTKTKHLGRKQENSLIENLFHQAQNKVRTPETGSVKEQQINYKLEMKPSTIANITSSYENPGEMWGKGVPKREGPWGWLYTIPHKKEEEYTTPTAENKVEVEQQSTKK